MAGSKSDFLEKAILNYLYSATALTPGASIYIALSTALYSEAATGASMTEVSATGTGYARVAVTRNTTNFPNATGNSPASQQNGTAQTFPTATASWGNIKSFYFVDAASGGNVYHGGDLTTAKDIATGDTATFAALALTTTED